MITEDIEDDFRPHSIPYVVTGTFILWVCWLFFNGGSTYKIIQNSNIKPEVVMMNTILSAASAGLVSVFFKNRILCSKQANMKYDLGSICNGILIGLVGVTGSCHNVASWAAITIGALSGFVYALSTKLMFRLEIDDPLEASQVHGFGGLTGVIAAGIFDKTTGLIYTASFK